MDNTVKTVGAYILGVATGLGIAYVISAKRQAEYTSEDGEETQEYPDADISETVTTGDFKVDTQDVIDAMKDDSLKKELEALAAKYKEKPSYEDIPSFKQPKSEPKIERPYVIGEAAWNELPDYEQIGLTYYVDGKLADSEDDLVENADFVVGTEWKKYFDMYDEDVVRVRNDALKCDYEIARDMRKYRDILKDKPYLAHNIFNAEQMAFIDGDDEE